MTGTSEGTLPDLGREDVLNRAVYLLQQRFGGRGPGHCHVWTDKNGWCRQPARVIYQNLDDTPDQLPLQICCNDHRPLPHDLHRILGVIV